jgi:hypothetical protein
MKLRIEIKIAILIVMISRIDDDLSLCLFFSGKSGFSGYFFFKD